MASRGRRGARCPRARVPLRSPSDMRGRQEQWQMRRHSLLA
jgi:hypothetical protein